MMFFLGTHEEGWLATSTVPLFVSRRRLFRNGRRLPKSTCAWALDSGGFTELSMFGEWRTSKNQYLQEVTRIHEHVGGLFWAAIQDWMCEPFILAKTGLTIRDHQQRTIQSLLDLRSADPETQWTPVIQGWMPDDYLRHVDDYSNAGVDLFKEAVVGVGSGWGRSVGARQPEGSLP